MMRYGFDSGVIQAEEVSRVIFVWLTFGGAFLVARQGGEYAALWKKQTRAGRAGQPA